MQAFRYRAADAGGQIHQGRVEAADEAGAARALVSQGLTPLQLAGVVPAAPILRRGAGSRIQPADRIALVQELATLLGAGVSLAEALPSLVEAYAGGAVGAALSRADAAVRAGQTLSAALAVSPLGLPPYVMALCQAGEASGELAAALRDGALQMERERQVAQELRSALIYPAVLVVAGILAVSVIFVGVVPRFAGILKSARAQVPEISRWVIEAGVFVKANLAAFGFGSLAVVLVAATLLSRAGFRQSVLEAMSRAPVLGAWILRVEVGRWATVFSRLLANRVPIIDALALSGGILRLRALRADLARAGRELERGRALSDFLAGCRWFPPNRLNLVRVGERSGELPRLLGTLGEVESEAARVLQKRALALIEPAAILVIGAAIGFVMVAVMMAITSLNTMAL